MQDTKFTMNAFLLVVIIISAIFLFFTVKVVDLSDRSAYNDYYPIEGTDMFVLYSSLEPNGVYEGDRTTGTLRVEGNFGYDWGAAAEGGSLYLNEYTDTDLGVMLCRVVRVDMNTFEKQVLWKDAVLRGRCASGELVCLRGCFMPTSFPKTNSLCRLYAMSAPKLDPRSDGAEVLFLDPATGEVLYTTRDDEALTDVFEERYIDRTLREVMG